MAKTHGSFVSGRTLQQNHAMAKYARYLELAQQAKVLGDEIATQHNLQHAEHWYRTAMADRQPEQDARAAFDEEILVS